MILYNPEYIKQTIFFTKTETDNLFNITKNISIDDIIKQINNKSIADKMCFDFIYTSAVIEGNSYTRGEAQTLFETKKPVSTKNIDDANMLLNIKTALNYVLFEKPVINKHTIKELHQILAQGLLPPDKSGCVRTTPVFIANSDYKPLDNAHSLETQMDIILSNYNRIQNIFDKAVYIHNNIAYLQYFQDCNKRLARIIQTLSLINNNMPFLSYNALEAKAEISARYKDALLAYYEQGNTKPYTDFFIAEYTRTINFIKGIIIS